MADEVTKSAIVAALARLRGLACLGCCLLMYLSPAAGNADANPIPDTLTLEQSLVIARNSPLATALADAASEPGDAKERLAIMVTERFFSVLLADQKYMADDEAMTVSFLTVNRHREQQSLFDNYTDLQVQEKQRHYADKLAQRQASDIARFRSRVKLAHAIGITSHVVGEVTAPDISTSLARPVPEYQAFIAASAAEGDESTLDVGDVQRRERALDTIHRLRIIRHQLDAIEAEEHYRDLYLDKSRALYEMEQPSDLGHAQAALAAVLWRQRKLEYELVVDWMRLDALARALR